MIPLRIKWRASQGSLGKSILKNHFFHSTPSWLFWNFEAHENELLLDSMLRLYILVDKINSFEDKPKVFAQKFIEKMLFLVPYEESRYLQHDILDNIEQLSRE